MADYAEEVSLKDVKLNDRWIGIGTIGPVTVNGDTPGNALTRVRMVFRLGQSLFTLDSADGEITIDDADTWKASIAAMDTFLPRDGLWSWEMEFFWSGATSPWTLFYGQIRCHPELV